MEDTQRRAFWALCANVNRRERVLLRVSNARRFFVKTK